MQKNLSLWNEHLVSRPQDNGVDGERRVALHLFFALFAVWLWLFPTVGHGKNFAEISTPTGAVIFVGDLPVQAQEMLDLILKGGPFENSKDGAVFANRERQLPVKARPFYREYTVRTPGQRTRGAKRIVCGGLNAVRPEVCYYTNDHYASFRKIIQQ